MPRLLVFAPCEKVILDQHGNPSLIAIIQGLATPPLPANSNLPPNPMGMMRWDVFTLWQQEPGDADREFVQVCHLVGPDNVVSLKADMQFKIAASTQRNIMSFFGFPLATPGEHLLKLSLRAADSDEVKEIAIFPMTVTREGKA